MRALVLLLVPALLTACAHRPAPIAVDAVSRPELPVHELRDQDGRLLFVALDQDGDGVADRSWTHRYDARGRLISSALDQDLDGVFDAIRYADHSRPGQLAEAIDLDADGVIDVRHVFGADAVADGGEESARVPRP